MKQKLTALFLLLTLGCVMTACTAGTAHKPSSCPVSGPSLELSSGATPDVEWYPESRPSSTEDSTPNNGDSADHTASGNTSSPKPAPEQTSSDRVSSDSKDTSSGNTSSDKVSSQAPHRHQYAAKVTSPTCTKEGFTTYTCACGAKYIGKTTAPRGHDLSVLEVTKAPTYTAAGSEKISCSRCSYFVTRTLPKLERPAETSSAPELPAPPVSSAPAHTHVYQAAVVAPTCTKQGYTLFSCSCGDSYTDHTVPARGHLYQSDEQIKAPTETETGLHRYYCGFCDYYLDEVLPKVQKVQTLVPVDDCTVRADQAAADALEQAVFKYLNRFRALDGSGQTARLPRLSELCRYRSGFLAENFAHDTALTKEIFTEFRYGDPLEETRLDPETGVITPTGRTYYAIQGGMEAISMAGFGPYTVDQWAYRVAKGLYESPRHWGYVGSKIYPFMAVGIHSEGGTGYTTVYVMKSDKYESQ